MLARFEAAGSADISTISITTSVVERSPAGAPAIAQGVAVSLIDELESPSAGGLSPFRLPMITIAAAHLSPSSSSHSGRHHSPGGKQY